jgi:exonuclease SbcD
VEGPIEDLLRDPALAAAESARVRVILTDEMLPLQAKARLQRRFPHIAELRHRPPLADRQPDRDRQRRARQASSPLDLLTAFYAEQQGRPASPEEERLLRRALEVASGRESAAETAAESAGGTGRRMSGPEPEQDRAMNAP